jgi:hypothetical protein
MIWRRVASAMARKTSLEAIGMELIAEAEFDDELRWFRVGPQDAQTSLTLVVRRDAARVHCGDW